MALATFLFVFLAALNSHFTNQWDWFSRSGSIAIIMGVLLGIRPIIRLGLKGWFESLHTIDCGNFVPTEDEMEKERQSKLDSEATKLGAIFSILGALISAYGDLIGHKLVFMLP